MRLKPEEFSTSNRELQHGRRRLTWLRKPQPQTQVEKMERRSYD